MGFGGRDSDHLPPASGLEVTVVVVVVVVVVLLVIVVVVVVIVVVVEYFSFILLTCHGYISNLEINAGNMYSNFCGKTAIFMFHVYFC